MPTAEELVSVNAIVRLGEILSSSSPKASRWANVRACASTLGPLGLSARARAVRDALLLDLPGGYRQVADVTRASLTCPDLSGWMIWPVTEAVAVVRRSTANHLNDVSRLDPRLATDTATRWLAAATDTTSGVVRHAMRTLIRQGDPVALELLGFSGSTESLDPIPGRIGSHTAASSSLTPRSPITRARQRSSWWTT